MKGLVTFNKSGSGSTTGKLIIPAPLLEILNIKDGDKEGRTVNITLKGKKIIIEKSAD